MNHYGIMTQAVHLASFCLREKETTDARLQKALALNDAYKKLLGITCNQHCEPMDCDTCPAQPQCEEAETELYNAREDLEAAIQGERNVESMLEKAKWREGIS